MGPDELVSNWISTSRQPHRITSGQSGNIQNCMLMFKNKQTKTTHIACQLVQNVPDDFIHLCSGAVKQTVVHLPFQLFFICFLENIKSRKTVKQINTMRTIKADHRQLTIWKRHNSMCAHFYNAASTIKCISLNKTLNLKRKHIDSKNTRNRAEWTPDSLCCKQNCILKKS